MGCCFSTGASLLADTDSKHVVVEMASVDSGAGILTEQANEVASIDSVARL